MVAWQVNCERGGSTAESQIRAPSDHFQARPKNCARELVVANLGRPGPGPTVPMGIPDLGSTSAASGSSKFFKNEGVRVATAVAARAGLPGFHKDAGLNLRLRVREGTLLAASHAVSHRDLHCSG